MFIARFVQVRAAIDCLTDCVIHSVITLAKRIKPTKNGWNSSTWEDFGSGQETWPAHTELLGFYLTANGSQRTLIHFTYGLWPNHIPVTEELTSTGSGRFENLPTVD